MIDWTIRNVAAASAQGWQVRYQPDNPQNKDGRSPFLLQADPQDWQRRFTSDLMAWLHVIRRARCGDYLPNKALKFLAEVSPGEAERILKVATGEDNETTQIAC